MNCSACGRKLLSQASARCNWCGKTIPDPDFQARADAARAEYFAHIAAHDAASLLAMEGLPSVPRSMRPLPPVAPPEPSDGAVTTEEDDARARFGHLEL